MSKFFQVPSTLLNHPVKNCSFQWHHVSRHHARGTIPRNWNLCCLHSWFISHEAVVTTHLLRVFCPLRSLLETSDLGEQGCQLVQRHGLCTNFDKEGVSAHALVVLSMSASLPCFVFLTLVCSLLTVPPCHPSHHLQPDKHSTNRYSHVSSTKVLHKDRWLHVSLESQNPSTPANLSSAIVRTCLALQDQSWYSEGVPTYFVIIIDSSPAIRSIIC